MNEREGEATLDQNLCLAHDPNREWIGSIPKCYRCSYHKSCNDIRGEAFDARFKVSSPASSQPAYQHPHKPFLHHLETP